MDANSSGLTTAFIAVDVVAPDGGTLDWTRKGDGFSTFIEDEVGVDACFGVATKPSEEVGPKAATIPIRKIADELLMVRVFVSS